MLSSESGHSIANLVNQTDMGLAACVYSRNLGETIRLTESLECGMVGVNTGAISGPAAPFGGIVQSGIFREGGQAGIEEYTELQYLNVTR